MEIELRPFATADAEFAAQTWTAVCGPELGIDAGFVAFNTLPTPGVAQAGRVALCDGAPAGFVLASAVTDDPSVTPGWIDALAVAPAYQRQGCGAALLAWAEAWLREQNVRRIRLGGSLRPFVPGLPVTAHAASVEAWFAARGYTSGRDEWDVARDLRDYPDDLAPATDAALRPVSAAEEQALFDFLGREFPGRWLFECQEYRRQQGRMADYLLLWAGDAAVGFCQITLEDSLRPIGRFFPQRLPHPWGQFGPLGVAQAARGKGYGAAVVDGAARYLRDLGVRGCVIDWTSLVEFYGKFGFAPYTQYRTLVKDEG